MKKLTIASIIAAALLAGGIYTLYPDPVAPDVYAPTSGISFDYSEKLRTLATPRFPAGVAFPVGKFEKMDNLVIYGAVFNREAPEEVFPKDMKGTIFLCAHLDNVLIPKGTDTEPNYIFNDIDGQPCGSHDYYKVQKDKEDWKIKLETGEPIEPLNKDVFKEYGLSLDPKDLPKIDLDAPITDIAAREPKRLDYIKNKQAKKEAIYIVPPERSLDAK